MYVDQSEEMDIVILKTVLTRVLEELGYLSVCLERLLYKSDEDTVLDIMEESGPMNITVRGHFEAYVWDYIIGARGALHGIQRLFWDRIELLSYMRGDIEQKLRMLGSTGHELLHGSEDFGEAWEDILSG